MDSARWERIQELFHLAADLPSQDRRPFLSRACSDDTELIQAVMASLEEDDRGESLLDRGVAAVAGQLFESLTPVASGLHGFGPYRIVRALGEGGMGVVYLAERSDLGSLAAIKILRDASLSPARRDRFASEQRTLAQLNHPGIAHLYDVGTLTDGTPWIAMEYVEGVPLTDHCVAKGLSMPERLRLFRDACAAVQHAHRHLIVHCDLKPSNILVTEDRRVKLLDFGISKHLDGLGPSSDLTRTGLRPMTPAYAVPEQIRGGRTGLHTDVYSLGIVLYELLTGRHAFDFTDRTPGEAETIIIEQEPEKPSTVARREATGFRRGRWARLGPWADLDVLCLTAMHKDPSRRYQTVEALIRDVDHYLAGEPLEARPESLRYRVGKFVRRNVRPIAAAAAVVVVVIGVVAIYTYA